MIRVRFIAQDGLYQIDAIGHARSEVCAAAGMILQAAGLGLRDLAKQYPRDITFDGHAYGSATEKIDSDDKRKRRSR